MIKVFSPEAFKDYAIDSVYYSCISSPTESRWYISKDKVTSLVNLEYREYTTTIYQSVDQFFTYLNDNQIILKGDVKSEILKYDDLITALEDWFNMVSITDYFVDIPTFKNYMTVKGYGIDPNKPDQRVQNFIAIEHWVQGLYTSGIIVNSAVTKAKITILDNFKEAIKNNFKIDDTEVNKIINDTESGIEASAEMWPSLYYSFILAKNRLPWVGLNENETYIYDELDRGKAYDTGTLYESLPGGKLLGYELFGITNDSTIQHYFLVNKFADIMRSKDVGDYTPQEFVDDLVSDNVLKIVKGNYRIINLDILKSRYSMYCVGVNYNDFKCNGDIVIQPDTCVESVEINSNWELSLSMSYREDGTDSFIQKGCIISVPVRVFREQKFPNQLWRVYDIQRNFDKIEIVGYPVAQESAFECPVNAVYWDNVTAKDVASKLMNIYPEKYAIETDIDSSAACIYAENSNMQQIICGTDEATFINMFGGDVVYDNYIYRLLENTGHTVEDADNYLIQYKSNMSGISINENTFDVVTRIYPTSQDGYDMDYIQMALKQYTDNYGEFVERQVDYFYFNLFDFALFLEENDNSKMGSGSDIGLEGEFGPTQELGPQGEVTTSVFTQQIDVITNKTQGIPDTGTASKKITLEAITFVNFLLLANVVTVKTRNGTPVTSEYLNQMYWAIDAMDEDLPFKQTKDIVVYPIMDYGEGSENLIIRESDVAGGLAYPPKFLDQVAMMRTDISAGSFVKTVYKRVQITNTSNIPKYQDAPNIDEYPFVHARSIKYDIPLIDTSETDPNDFANEVTLSQKLTSDAANAIKTKTASLSKSYLTLARKGSWNHKKRIKIKDKTITHNNWEYMHTKPYKPRKDRVALPYGYIFYSFKDSIEYLKNEAVLSWCTNEEEANIFCQAIEDGFAWCGKTNVAKWAWHTDGTGQYYGTKNKSDGIFYAYHKIGNVWYWFNYGELKEKTGGKLGYTGGYITKDLLNYEDYKWVETEVNLTEEEKKQIDEQKKQEKEEGTYDELKYKVYPYKKFQYKDSNGKMMKDCWIEESKNRHYHVNKEGWRDKEDDDEWTFRTGTDGNSYRITGWRYGNFEKNNYPEAGQFLYCVERKAWYYFEVKGVIQGTYLSNENWKWKKYKKGWRYTDGHGEYLWGQWAKIDSKWYWFNEHGYADETTDDFDTNAQSFNTTNKHPETDYNREGVGSISTGSDSESAETTSNFNSNRDGVQAWIQAGFIKELKKEILKQHFYIWENLRERLNKAAVNDLRELRNESISVEVDFVDLRNYRGYEQLKYLEDLYLGDYVHVVSSFHNYDGYLRVVAIEVDCTTGQKTKLTLGYPVNSFVKRTAKLNKKGTVKLYSPYIGIEDGYGGYINTGFPDSSQIYSE